MNALLAFLLMFGADERTEARKLHGPLLPPSLRSWSRGLEHVDGVWQCSVEVNILRRSEELTDSGKPRSTEEEERLQELLRPMASEAARKAALLNPRLGSLDPELEVTIELYPVDEERQELWSAEVRTVLLVPARLVVGGLSVRAPVWELVLKGTIARGDLDPVLALGVERSVKGAGAAVEKARAATKRGSNHVP